ncbi:MAG TPA: YlbF family regulator [Spirochaetota bacterium]|nr:YlbF family regulator [Spirochaetota bacterium]HPI89244.1 YlbF family regulator [Spirochaetota bacterium]HPR48596.1 YlbF family regulator [Spirochaetota bacterium]
MTASQELIIEKTKELSLLIKEHPITRKYEECLSQIMNDQEAKDLLSELIMMGQDLNEKALKGQPMGMDSPSEHEFLKTRFENKPIVKSFIQAEKDYFNLLKMVIEKIKNP